ncbi:transcription antitermination factor NusB [Candidatus Shikimatogenerans bostrichidophilus]|uniref:transcription antitermination factor NusB n=1 Tax=Candidatus Shikimatogenerans bostrichidophilus TaxID=2943807 RepID=UPI0029672975
MKFIKIKNYFRIKIMKILFIINYNKKFNYFKYLNNNFNYLNKVINKILIKINKKKLNKNNIINSINKYINNLNEIFLLQYEDKKFIKYILFLKIKYNILINIFDNFSFIIKIINYINKNNKLLIDIINNYLVNWSITRINIIDLIVIKIAISEFIIYYKDININIIINEYKLIILIFSSKNNINFINGILNNILKSKNILSLYDKTKN